MARTKRMHVPEQGKGGWVQMMVSKKLEKFQLSDVTKHALQRTLARLYRDAYMRGYGVGFGAKQKHQEDA